MAIFIPINVVNYGENLTAVFMCKISFTLNINVAEAEADL